MFCLFVFLNWQKLAWGWQGSACFSSSLGWCCFLIRPSSPLEMWVDRWYCHTFKHLFCLLWKMAELWLFWFFLCLCLLYRFCLCQDCRSLSAWSVRLDFSSRDIKLKPPASSWVECLWFWSAGRSLVWFWRSTVSSSYSGQLKQKWEWSVSLYSGLKWSLFSILSLSLSNRGFFPVAVGFIRRVPVLGSLLSLPGIRTVSIMMIDDIWIIGVLTEIVY